MSMFMMLALAVGVLLVNQGQSEIGCLLVGISLGLAVATVFQREETR